MIICKHNRLTILFKFNATNGFIPHELNKIEPLAYGCQKERSFIKVHIMQEIN